MNGSCELLNKQLFSKNLTSILLLQLMPETLYLTCNLIDRFLEIKNVSRKRLQLVRSSLTLLAAVL